jgi:hypothetical protein
MRSHSKLHPLQYFVVFGMLTYTTAHRVCSLPSRSHTLVVMTHNMA